MIDVSDMYIYIVYVRVLKITIRVLLWSVIVCHDLYGIIEIVVTRNF